MTPDEKERVVTGVVMKSVGFALLFTPAAALGAVLLGTGLANLKEGLDGQEKIDQNRRERGPSCNPPFWS